MRDDRLNEILDGKVVPTTREEQFLLELKRDLQMVHAATPEPQLSFERVRRAIEAAPDSTQRAVKWNLLVLASPAVVACALGLWMINSSTTKDTLRQSTQASVVSGPVVSTAPVPRRVESPSKIVESAPLTAQAGPESRQPVRTKARSPRRTRPAVTPNPRVVVVAKSETESVAADVSAAAAPMATTGNIARGAAADTLVVGNAQPAVAHMVVIISSEVTATGTQAAVERMGVSDVVVGG